MKSKDILVELIEHLSAYENDCEKNQTKITMNDFVGYLNLKYEPQSSKRDELSGGVEDWRAEHAPADKNTTDISILIAVMFRHAKGYVKKAMKNSLLKSADEFSFLITLLTYDSMSKIELINSQIMEKTSGNEIINRLIKLGFIEQEANPHDKRSLNIRISQKGRNELMKILPQMQIVSEIVSGNLTENEKYALLYILRKLDRYHNEIFHNKRKYELTDLLEEMNVNQN